MHPVARFPISIVFVVASCGVSNGSPGESAVMVVDDRGDTVALARPATRVISVIPSVTQTIVALEARDHLVARTRYDRQSELRDLPSVGGTLDPSLEAMVGLAPHLVIVDADRDNGPTQHLRAAGLTVYHADVETVADILRNVRSVGTLLGLSHRAAALVEDVERRLAMVEATVAGRPRPSVLYVVWPDPPQTAGPGTYLNELITVSGGDNAFADAPGAWPQLSLEAVAGRDPDAIVAAVRHDGAEGGARWLEGPVWRDLSAVRAGRVLVVSADLFNRPGPGVVEAAERLARFLHPEAFGADAHP